MRSVVHSNTILVSDYPRGRSERANNESTLTHSHKSIYTPELSLPRVCHRQCADPSELRVELRPLRVELLAYVQTVTGTDPVLMCHGP